MTLTEEQRSAIEEAANICYEVTAFDVAAVLQAMIDSGDQIGEPNKIMGVDLEKARYAAKFDDRMAITMFPLAIAEIERLRAALAESEKVVEHKGKSATHWHDEHLRAQTDLTQSKRVIEQQVARIKSLKKEIRRLKHESKVEQEFTNSYIKRLHDAEARIKELGSSLDEAEALTKKNAELINGYLERIKVLEKNCIYDPEDGKIFVPDGHPEIERLRARVVALEDALVEELATDIAYEDRLLWSRLGGQRQEEYREKARQQLKDEGKIGPEGARKPIEAMNTEELSKWSVELSTLLGMPAEDRENLWWQIAVGNHLEKFVESWQSKNPRSWQITKERMRAIRMAEELAWDCKAVAVLRAMLLEAGQE